MNRKTSECLVYFAYLMGAVRLEYESLSRDIFITFCLAFLGIMHDAPKNIHNRVSMTMIKNTSGHC